MTARDYSTTFGADCKDSKHRVLAILLSQRDRESKEETGLAKKKFGCSVADVHPPESLP
jgi:hypothetical protein